MIANLKMEDSLFETYVKKFGIPGCYHRMKFAITLCKDLDKNDRAILIAGDTRLALEKVFQTTIDDPSKLVRLVQNMNTVKLGNIDMEFSQDQLERLNAQAGFHGRTLETYIKETVAELRETMLERV